MPSSLQIVIPGSDYSGRGLGWVGDSWPDPTGDALYATYFTGAGNRNVPTRDWTWQRRDLTVPAGVAPATSDGYFTAGSTSYYEAPFSAGDVLALRGEMTMVSVVRVGVVTSQASFIGNYPGLAEKSCILGYNSAYRAFANPGTGAGVFAELARSASTGTIYEFVAGVWSETEVRLHRKSAAPVDAVASTPLTVPPGGDRLIRIGRSHSPGTYLAAHQSAAHAVYNRALTPDQINAVYLGLKPFLLAETGIVI